MEMSELLRRESEDVFTEWWENYSETEFPSQLERRAFLAGYDRAIELTEREERE